MEPLITKRLAVFPLEVANLLLQRAMRNPNRQHLERLLPNCPYHLDFFAAEYRYSEILQKTSRRLLSELISVAFARIAVT